MNGVLPIKPILEILQSQTEYIKQRVIEELMESLSPQAHEEAIFLEMEWLSPYGLDRAQEHLSDLKKDVKKDTAKVPESQDDYIRKGDKVRVNRGEFYGHSFIVSRILPDTCFMLEDEEGTWWDIEYLEKCKC